MRRRILHTRLRSTVIVTTSTGASYRGALYDVDEQAVVLRNVEHYTDGSPIPVDGEVILLLIDIAVIQRL
jgi:small nuclear ribonucleoprotein (snRNP)-like protein